jgi:Family of unknown function (DUF6421)/Domain of unknown function (DUF4350)
MYAPFMRGTTLGRVLFDEAHSEAWTIRPELAQAMQPAHPGDASYALAAGALSARDFTVECNAQRELSSETLRDYDVLVIAHPSDPAWERTTGSGLPRLSDRELDAIESFVAAGGGLIVLGETEQEKYGNNLNELLSRFGLRLANDTVQDYEHHLGAPSWVLAELAEGERGQSGDLLARVHAACFYRATTISSSNGARVLARTHATASRPGAPLLVAGEHGMGRVVVLADSDLFGDDCIDELDHRALWLNLCYWAARARSGAAPARARTGPEQDAAWLRLRAETDALAQLQSPDGAVAGDGTAAESHVTEIAAALEALAPRFPHQSAYLAAVGRDLHDWQRGGFQRPDFTRSLEAFRPELQREDGIEHLVFFPMYKQNGPRETCCEALLIRVPWPDWIAELERTRYDNPKFVPVELLDGTRGYRSECATLFPETVSVAARPVNNFGAIFCDREAARLRRVAGAAADLLALNLPPDAATMLASPMISQQAYILWDLIHDRTHSHGELPFDPFMIRQRSPYWMYSLEELRCDLTAFGEALSLEREVPFARHVQYAILLDRLLRFPITGPRVRNYDGLGGQLLFAYLHRHGYLHWADNRLTIDWERVGDGVIGLRAQIEDLYRAGIDRTKLQHWAAAHDLISANVPAASGSSWVAGVRDLPEAPDPRPYVDLVLEDEFPLSIFYTTLKAKLAPQ